MRVASKVALITGGAGGLGAACARRLLEEGAVVVVTDVHAAPEQRFDGVTYLQHDVCVADDWKRILEKIVERHGRLDILVHCAGIEGNSGQGGLRTTEADWNNVIAVNLTGTFLGCKATLATMLPQGRGSIILLASANTAMATPQALAYGASKAAITHLARSIAVLAAREGTKIRCNTVHPGSIDTLMSERLIAAIASNAGLPVAQVEERFRAAIPLGERGSPEDVASLVLYLASDESSYATGGAFTVDGAWSIKAAG